MSRLSRKLARTGHVTCRLQSSLGADRVEPLLNEAFELEHRGWKGAAGTSVLGHDGMFEFFLRQAKQLAAWGQLELCLLEVDGRVLDMLGRDVTSRRQTLQPGIYFILNEATRESRRVMVVR